MTRLAVPSRPRSPLDEARQALDQVEARLGSLRGSGTDAVEILSLLDRAAGRLEELEAAGADMRTERVRLESVWQGLQRQARAFLREVGPALRAERERREAETLGPWWSLDRIYAQTQRRALRKRLLVALAAALVVAAGWLVYERFLAPPPSVRQALRHAARGQERLEAGDPVGALAEFEAAACLTPDDPEMLLWIGILRQRLGDEDGAQAAYEAARDLGLNDEEFLLQRGTLFLQVGDLERARADAEAVVGLSPRWGYGFYLRACVEEAAGEIQAAVADYRHAADLANAAGDAQLEATARVRMGLLIQYQP
ncbi:MAG TPA: hypothetical protein ENI37_06730 [Chloroflexi bacterium]|nr:hypothetical protein [Chloroflexota bacterium]